MKLKKKVLKALKSKKHELTVWAIRDNGSEYCVSVIRNEADLHSEEIDRELKEVNNDLSVDRIEVYVSRRLRHNGGARVIGKPVCVINRVA